MKSFFLSTLLLSTPALAANGELKAAAQKLSAAHKDAIVWLSVIAKTSMTTDGDAPQQIKAALQGQDKETKSEATGTVVDASGLIVTSLAAIDKGSVVDGKTIHKAGGSLTALPIIETQAGDVSAYIPTNVISITDGQIFLESDLFFAGVRPAINVGISVSRVGGSAQIKAMKQVAGRLRLDLAQYRELEAFAAFASDLDAATKKQLDRGARTVEVLKQPQYSPVPVDQQVMTIFAVTNGFLDDIAVKDLKAWEKGFHEFMATKFPQVGNGVRTEKAISKDNEAALRRGIEEYKKMAGK